MDSESNPSQEPASKPGQSEQQQTNPSELFSSVKIMAEAAQTTFRHGTEKINKAEVADAARDLLGTVSDYAKLDQTSYGKYVAQAEDYFQKQSSSQPPATAAEPAPPKAELAGGEAQSEARDEEPKKSSSDSSGEEQIEGGGSILKMAEGFLKNSSRSSGSEGGQSAGVADCLKIAGGFFKK